MGLRLAALEALERGGLVEFGPEGAELAGAARGAARWSHVSPGACACWWWTTTTSCNGASACCSPSSRGWSAACPPEQRRGDRARAPLQARTSRWSTSSSATSRAPSSARRSGASLPRTRVLLISGAGWISPQAAQAAGASGFVSKDWSADDVAMAVRMVGMGMTVFAPQAEQPAAPLSEREREVLALIATGATNREIAGGCTSRRTPSRSTRAGSTASSASQPRRGGAARPAARADRVYAPASGGAAGHPAGCPRSAPARSRARPSPRARTSASGSRPRVTSRRTTPAPWARSSSAATPPSSAAASNGQSSLSFTDANVSRSPASRAMPSALRCTSHDHALPRVLHLESARRRRSRTGRRDVARARGSGSPWWGSGGTASPRPPRPCARSRRSAPPRPPRRRPRERPRAGARGSAARPRARAVDRPPGLWSRA